MAGGDHLTAFNEIVSCLSEFDEENQQHILDQVYSWFKFPPNARVASPSHIATPDSSKRLASVFSGEREQTPKEFLMEKEPHTNVERVACLAFYLTHYRGTPHFKTLDISKLNTEAAQPKFTNPSVALNDTAKSGLIVASTKGAKQLSSIGEQYVLALPDHDEAKKIQKKMKPKRRRKTVQKSSSK